jgi:hypothetical protein
MKYSDICPPPKLLVRRETIKAMIEHGPLVEELIEKGRLSPLKSTDGGIDLFLVSEVKVAIERWAQEARRG